MINLDPDLVEPGVVTVPLRPQTNILVDPARLFPIQLPLHVLSNAIKFNSTFAPFMPKKAPLISHVTQSTPFPNIAQNSSQFLSSQLKTNPTLVVKPGAFLHQRLEQRPNCSSTFKQSHSQFLAAFGAGSRPQASTLQSKAMMK